MNNFDAIVESFDRLIDKIKVHRNSVDEQLNKSHERTLEYLSKLRSKRDQEYQEEHDELVRGVKEFQKSIEEEKRRLEKAFRSVCCECSDKIRKVLY